MGTPPPPPPPGVPTLEETEEATDGRVLTTRERMEIHRANPACSSCHNVIDPIGLAFENFDVTGAWRARDQGNLVETEGALVVYTLVNEDQRVAVRDRAAQYGVAVVDLMGGLMARIGRWTGEEPVSRPGLLHRLDEDYFRRIEALEFAVKNDDGKLPRNFKQADMVVVDENPLENLKVLYGNGAVKLNDETGEVERIGGIKYTIKDGIVYDAQQMLDDVREMVRRAKEERAVSEQGS